MRIEELHAEEVLPVKIFSATNLADIVVIAGPNGVGKTRLIKALIQFFQSPKTDGHVRLVIGATCKEELTEWGKRTLDTSVRGDIVVLQKSLQQSRRLSGLQRSVVNFESDRSIERIEPYTFNWDYSDPFEQKTGWNIGLSGLQQRYKDTVHALFKKVRSHREGIAQAAEKLRSE